MSESSASRYAAEDEQTRGRCIGDDMAQELETGLVGPMEIVEHEDRRLGSAGQLEESHDRVIEQVPLGIGITALQGRQRAETLLQGWNQTGELAPMGDDVGFEHFLIGVGDVMRQRFAEGAVGSDHLFVAAAEQHGHALLMDVACQFRDERGLSLARLSGHQDHLAASSGSHTLRRGQQNGKLLVASDHPHSRSMGQPGGQWHRPESRDIRSEWFPSHL